MPKSFLSWVHYWVFLITNSQLTNIPTCCFNLNWLVILRNWLIWSLGPWLMCLLLNCLQNVVDMQNIWDGVFWVVVLWNSVAAHNIFCSAAFLCCKLKVIPLWWSLKHPSNFEVVLGCSGKEKVTSLIKADFTL